MCRCCSKHKVSCISEQRQSSLLLTHSIAFNEFIHERETKSAKDPVVMLFDQIILAKKNRGRTSLFNKSSKHLEVLASMY